MGVLEFFLVAPLIVLLLVGVFHLGGLHYKLQHILEFGHNPQTPDTKIVLVKIVPSVRHIFSWRGNMATVNQGSDFLFTVACFNAAGLPVTPTDASVSVDVAALGSATVNSDGSGGDFKAGTTQVGSCNMVATAGGVMSSPFTMSVVADNVIKTVTIVPAAAPAPAPAPAPAAPVTPAA
jgi:hypothetical protein